MAIHRLIATHEVDMTTRRSRRTIVWTPQTRQLLGRLTDRQLGARMGISIHHVAVERRRQGLPPARPAEPITWTPERLAQLGTVPDVRLAAAWGISSASIWYKRIELGRPPAGRTVRAPRYTWTPAMVADLATLSCRAFASRHGVPPNRVLVERHRRGIAGPASPHRRMPEEHLELLGTMPDRDFAMRFGYDPQHVGTIRVRAGIASHRQRQHAFRWTPYRLSRLGRESDRALATRWGTHVERIRLKRAELGRTAAYPKAVWTAEMRVAARSRPIRAVMALYGLSESQVRKMRNRLLAGH